MAQSNCLFRNKYRPDLDRFETKCYSRETGEIIECSECETCPDYTVECRESQEWTYGIDNTATDYAWPNATYEIVLSDGSTVQWTQTTASNGGWTDQLTEWAASIQASATAAGLAWFVEPRFIDTFNPPNIDGTQGGPGGNPSGLPGAPSVPVALALDAGGMRWRYVNIQICPGQPVPVSASIISHDDSPRLDGVYDNNGQAGDQLTTAGAVLGPISKFKVCVECDAEEDVWYILDATTGLYREANAGEIPNCWEPCGTLSLTDAPPDRDCEFFFDLGCDNLNQDDTSNFVQQVTRRATVCNGEQIAVDYFTEDPLDPTALIDYVLVGDFVDCDSGEVIDPPEIDGILINCCLLYTSPSPRDLSTSRMPSSA